MPFHPFRPPTHAVRRRASPVTVVVLAAIAAAGCGGGRAIAATSALSETAAFEADADPVASLEVARARTVRARAALDALKRAAQPGHLLDPLPDAGRTLAIEDLRSQYSTLQLKAATLAATLGDHHPDLVAAQQALADLRTQLLTSVKAAAAAAEREVSDARAAESSTQRELAARAPDITGSIGAQAKALAKTAPPPAPNGLLAASERRDVSWAATPSRSPAEQASTLTLMADADWDRLMMALAAVVLGALAAAVALFALLAPRRQRSTEVEPPAGRLVEPVIEPDAQLDVPVLATIALPAAAGAARLVFAMEHEPDGTMARSAALIAEMIQRAAEAAGFVDQVTVLVTPLSRSVEAEALAASIAVADAAAGHRVLLMDARPEGRLRDTLLAEAPVALLLELGSVIRPAYDLRVGGTTLTLLPNDPTEVESVGWAVARPGALRRRGLSSFDTVVVLGQGVEADAATLVAGADLVLIAAPEGTSPAALAAASALLKARSDRPCGAILVRADEESRFEPSRPAAMPAGPSWVEPAAPRTGRDPTRYSADRGGFRKTFDPSRERIRA